MPQTRVISGEDRLGGARDALIDAHLGLAYWWARRYTPTGIGLEDLRQVAAEALIRAADAFDPNRGVKFASYAGPCINGELKRYLRNQGWAVRPPRSLQEQALLVMNATDALTAELGRSPTAAELGQQVGLDVDTVLKARQCADRYYADSLDNLPGGSGSWASGVLAQVDPEIEKAENLQALAPLYAALPERDRQVLSMRFGAEMTQTQIAQALGVSQMQVSRLLHRCLAQLRRELLADST